ncbi:XTP/dITP diphosphatase [Weissella paramesenteroides]|uniref:XTP/dITP diphosphatase n=1 Tax=Weissella paramesenteroides TaxID=1249 RepID=UPI00123BCD4E|nr:XTP/dITP diphosphatase [Weissella paramesenteroides]KAA8454779.1 XTP/dITP diphosphatase [Weissella paramesenteroides]KAA8456793.1 XTP/dITP diphosphatase [Weissella paramesenteroides]KAA8460123.1 XTP/dITP diphosphatase [Weissella paramesenteroides]KAA8461669.1 XTP/dITP diphosphatase [Weissella paramesenteroides]KAA8461990.1 XTP/dITP diphosphatase [Weissella paramesenteroides]
MTKLIFASKNNGKIREFREFLSPFGVEVISLNDLEDVPEIDENGSNFLDNATIKAKTISDTYHLPVVADDSGLSVDALNGAPGVHSARYAGDHDDLANNKKLLSELTNVKKPDRTATFHTVIVGLKPTGEKIVADGSVNGSILFEEQGTDGFGYDPLFYYEPLHKSFAELTATEKNSVSHRGNALRQFIVLFKDWWGD